MSISRTFILRPVATALMMAGVILVGVVAFRQLPVSALPQVDYPTMQVQTFYPGASPEVVTSSITAPLEKQFGQVPGLTQMTSISSFGSSLITLQFSLDLSIDVAEQEVQAAINAAQNLLPQNLPVPPIYSKTNPADAPILTLALTSTTVPLPKIEELAETRMAQRISQLKGVGLVSISGGQRPAVRVRANPTALASYGLSLETLRTALTSANVNQAKGNFDGPDQAWTINDNDQLQAGAQYGPIIIAYRNGAPVRISDVATVIDGVENAKLAAWVNADRAIVLNIQRQPGTNIISVVDTVQALLPQIKASLPQGINVEVITDRTTTIRASVKDVEFELLLTIVLVVAVIFVFLRSAAATIIPGIAVPLSLVGTFARHVPARLQPRQPVADGADDLHRLRRRRCDRHDREHLALPGDGRLADGGRAEGLGGDRLHDRVADGVAHRRAHSAAVHGGHRRPPVPRVRGDARGHHHLLGLRVADADADDGRPDPDAPARERAGQVVPLVGMVLRQDDRSLRPDGAGGAAPPDRDAAGGGRDARPHDLPLRDRAERLLPGAGHRRHPRDFAGAGNGLVLGDVEAAAGARQGDPRGSGRRESDVVHRRRRREHDDEQRPDPDHVEAARGARRRVGRRRDPPSRPQAASRSPASSCSCSRCRI